MYLSKHKKIKIFIFSSTKLFFKAVNLLLRHSQWDRMAPQKGQKAFTGYLEQKIFLVFTSLLEQK